MLHVYALHIDDILINIKLFLQSSQYNIYSDILLLSVVKKLQVLFRVFNYIHCIMLCSQHVLT